MKKIFLSYIFTVCFISFSLAQQSPGNAKLSKYPRSSQQEHQQKIIDLKKKESANKSSIFIIQPEQVFRQDEPLKTKTKNN